MELAVVLHVCATLLCAAALGSAAVFTAILSPAMVRIRATALPAGVFVAMFRTCYSVLAALAGISAILLWGRSESVVLLVIAALFVFVRVALLPESAFAPLSASEKDVDDEFDRSAELLQMSQASASLPLLQRIRIAVDCAQLIALLIVSIRLIAR